MHPGAGDGVDRAVEDPAVAAVKEHTRLNDEPAGMLLQRRAVLPRAVLPRRSWPTRRSKRPCRNAYAPCVTGR